MAERYGFFDPVRDANGQPDRDYNAQQFTNYFKSLVTTGIMKGQGNQLSVSTSGSNMITVIDTGVAFIEGRFYENDSPLSLTHDTETLGKNRIDRIVVRLDLNTEARHVRAFIKKGVASASPVPPTLQRDALVYEISLAHVLVIGGQTYINVDDVADERGTDDICPWAGSKILPNFDDVALEELVNKVEQLSNAQLFDGDLNDLTETGFYTSNGADTAKNFPVSLSTLYRPIIEVFKSADNWIFQRFSYFNNQGSQVYIRGLVLGAWNAWRVVSKIPESWISATLASGWTNDTSAPLKYFKDSEGIVHIHGLIKGGTNVFTTLPVGYRPKENTFFPIMAFTGNAVSGFTFYVSNARIYTSGSCNFSVTLGSDGSYMINCYFKTE